MNLRALGQHQNELLRQVGLDARRQGKARSGGGDVAEVASADPFAVLGADQYVPPQCLPGTASAIDGHVRNLRVLGAHPFRKKT
jgi:hypothetical protein